MAVTAPQLTLLPNPPLPTDAEAVFDTKTGAFLIAEQAMVPQLNLSLTWVATQTNAIEGYATSAQSNAQIASAAAGTAQAAAAAVGSSLGLPSMVGNARRALAVLPNEQGVSYQTQIKLISIEPKQTASGNGTISLNIGTSGVFDVTPTGAATIALTNVPTLTSAESMVILVRVTQGSTAYAITWPAGIVWLTPGGIAPATPNAGKRTEYILTIEGSTIYGRKGGAN